MRNSKLYLPVVLAVASGFTIAQEAAQPAQKSRKTANRLLEEVVVTAQKREESAQDIPLAVAAYSPEKLDAFGIEDVQDLERITPGLTITNSAGYSLTYLRGVGTDAFLPGADSSVPFYIDGIALIGSQGSQDTLGRIERVEVLKGPQGTLFGRNATGGAINIITPNPSEELTGDIKLQAADYDEKGVVAFINVPLVDGLALALSGYDSSRDNYLTNTDGPVIDIYSRGLRGKLRWDISDSLAVTLGASIGETSNNAAIAFENTLPAPRVGGVSAIPADDKADRVIHNDQLSGAQNEWELYSVTFDWTSEYLDFKLIGSTQKLTAPFIQADFDGSPLPLVSFFSVHQVAEQDTLELQILSNENTLFADKLNWVAGLYYLEGYGGFDPLGLDAGKGLFDGSIAGLDLSALASLLGQVGSLAGLPVNPAQVRILTGGLLNSQSFSTYFQGNYALLSNLELTLGLRYGKERRSLEKSRMGLEAADGSEFIIREDHVPDLHAYQWSPRVALSWFPWDDDTQIYTSWARTYKSPTYNTVNLTETPEPVKEEQVTSTELGLKTVLFDGTLSLNAAIFYTQQQDLLTGMVAVASGGIVSYDNAGESEIKGWELDFLWTPMPEWNPGLVISGAATGLDTEYTSYPNGKGFDEDTGVAFGDGSTNALPARDFAGNKIVRTPDLTYTLGFNQSLDLGMNHVLEIGADAYYNDGFYFLPQNSDLYARESYTLVNAHISYFYTPWDLQITAFGENVTDVTYNEAVFVADLGRNQILNDPRVYGVRLNWTY